MNQNNVLKILNAYKITKKQLSFKKGYINKIKERMINNNNNNIFLKINIYKSINLKK